MQSLVRKSLPLFVLIILLGLIVVIVVGRIGDVETAASPLLEQESFLATPTAESTPTVESLPTFESHVTVAAPVEVASQWTPTPTWTPFPTFTPWPTPTRRPGPTTTPFPTRAPASDARGTIFYVVQEPRVGELVIGTDHDPGLRTSLHQFSVGPLAEKLAETTSIEVEQLHAFYNVTPSPDGRYLLLLQPAMPGGRPYILDMKTDRLYSLAQEGQYESGVFFGWHPDSQRILFWNDRDRFVWIDVVTLERTILGYMESPVQGASISPDGQEVIYATRLRTERNPRPEALWLSSTAGSDAHPLFVFGGASYVFSWSPDGQYILYMGGPGIEREAEALEKFTSRGPLWLVEPDGQNPRPLAGRFIAGAGYEPAWSPDSQWVLFTGLDEDIEYGCMPKRLAGKIEWPECQFVGTGVYMENVQSGDLRRLASGINPTWSPDGTTVAFLSIQSGTIEIWTVRLDGSDLRQLTNDGTVKNEFAWLPEPEVGQ